MLPFDKVLQFKKKITWEKYFHFQESYLSIHENENPRIF